MFPFFQYKVALFTTQLFSSVYVRLKSQLTCKCLKMNTVTVNFSKNITEDVDFSWDLNFNRLPAVFIQFYIYLFYDQFYFSLFRNFKTSSL